MSDQATKERVLDLLGQTFKDHRLENDEDEYVTVDLDFDCHLTVVFPGTLSGFGELTAGPITVLRMDLDVKRWEDYVGFVSLARKVYDKAADAKLAYWKTLQDIKDEHAA